MKLNRRALNRLLAVATLGLVGCGSRDERKAASPGATPASLPVNHRGSLRYLALGDSYTIGESVEPAERWPVQLAAAVRQDGLDLSDPEIIARTGWRTDDLDGAITQANPQGPYDLVSLLIGVNDQFQGGTASDYRQPFAVLLQRAIGFARGEPARVVVLSIPDWGATPFGRSSNSAQIAREIDEFNAINRAESEKAGVHYVDVTPVSRRGRQQADLIADDGLHPSAKMYAEWVKLALPQTTEALRKSKSQD